MLEDVTIPQERLPTVYRKLSLDPPLVDQVVNSVSSMIDPTLPFKSEVKVVESISSLPSPTLSSESVDTEVVTLAQYSSLPSLPIEIELKPT